MAKFRRGTPGNTFATFPTRVFSFLVDPTALPALGGSENIGALRLIRDLGALEWPVDVKLLWPRSIDRVAPADVSDPLTILLGGHLEEVRDGGETGRFVANSHMAETARAALGGDSAEQQRRRSLLALADDAQADGLVTGDDVLVGQRYDLLQHHRIRIVPVVEFTDVIEVCAHGHSIFWSAVDSERRLTVDVYYQINHWKQKRLASWYWAKRQDLEADLRDNVHSALINRYALLAYARDMVRFYELQLDYFHRRGLWGAFGTLLGYHMTNFYLYLWGMLEHLALIANQSKKLALRERDCGIESATLWKALGESDPALRAYIREGPIREWITAMADARHAAAHRAMLLPNYIVSETEESQKTDAEIAAILREEDPKFYALFPEPMIRILGPLKISHWRLWKLRTLATNAVVVKKESEAYIRFAVMSIDDDLMMLNAVIDAFLVRLFSVRAPATPPG
ncbi:MAG: hypothetical protein Q7W02_27435 [Candidatus Rokubacteria bacterium]|nr:hypothetical protein [Candidatus Rokubacteria bacterium]